MDNEKKTETYPCPECGGKMRYVGGLLDWECRDCEAEGELVYDDVNNEYCIEIAKSYSLEEIYKNPIANMPDCCKGCSSAYPDCLTSCKIFDN